MYTYQQSTGTLTRDGVRVGDGYSGAALGLNRPWMQAVPKVGPIPRGRYRIGQPLSSSHLGPMAFPLLPDPENLMYGRSGFFIHGDNSAMDKTASEGCIILAHPIRQAIASSGDADLTVTE